MNGDFDIFKLTEDPIFMLNVHKNTVRVLNTEIGGEGLGGSNGFSHIACLSPNGYLQGSYLATHYGKPLIPIERVADNLTVDFKKFGPDAKILVVADFLEPQIFREVEALLEEIDGAEIVAHYCLAEGPKSSELKNRVILFSKF